MVEIDRKKLSQALRRKINADHGSGTIGYAADLRRLAIDRYSTGSLSLDFALGGGIPAGRVTLIYGERSSGKTTTTLSILADAQRRCANCMRYVDIIEVSEQLDADTGEVEYKAMAQCDCYAQGLFKPRKADKEKNDDFLERLAQYETNSYEETQVLFMDSENALDFEWAMAKGVDIRRLLHVIPHNAEEAIDIYVQSMNSGLVDVFALDSIASLTPITEIEESAVKQQQGLAARLVNKFCRSSCAAAVAVEKIRLRPPTQIWINQTRQKIGVMFGDGTTLPGGKGQLFAASCMLKFWQSFKKEDNSRKIFGELKEEEKMSIAQSVDQCFKIEKNKTGPSHGEGRFELIVSGPNKGQVEEFGYVMHHAERYKLLQKEGTKWRLGTQEFRTKTEAMDAARDPQVMKALRRTILGLMQKELNS